MDILFDCVVIVISLTLIIIGAEWVLQGAVIIARKHRISDLAIASTLIAFGTGLPTIAVNIAMMLFSSSGQDVVIGNALGTNFVNIGLGLGIAALIVSIKTKYTVFEKELSILLALSAVLASAVSDKSIGQIEGFLLVVGYAVTLYIMYQYSRRDSVFKEDIDQIDLNTSTISNTETYEISFSTVYARVISGMIFLGGFSILLASMTEKFSRDFGISEYILGITIVGIGTSLPMVVTSVRSALKGYSDIVVGNVIGSTIANICLGLGVPALIAPLRFDQEAITDIYLFNLLQLVVLIGILVEGKVFGKNKMISRPMGTLVVFLYIVYLFSKFRI